MRTVPVGILLLIVFGLFLVVGQMDYADYKMEQEIKKQDAISAMQKRMAQRDREHKLKAMVSYDRIQNVKD